jgi:hypothetical protein
LWPGFQWTEGHCSLLFGSRRYFASLVKVSEALLMQ